MLKKAVKNLDKSLIWITRFAALNGLWLLFTVIGLGLFGIFPATIAALRVSDKWLKGEEIKLYQTFKAAYKQEFFAANRLGWVLGATGLVLYTNYLLLSAMEGQLIFIVPFFYYVLVFFFAIVCLWSFPLLAAFEGKTFDHIRNACIIGLTKFHITAAIGIYLFAVMYHSLGLPVLLLFYCFSVSLFGWNWLAKKVLVTLPGEAEQHQAAG